MTGRLSAPDLDECAFPGVCPSGVCTNTAGSFSCRDCEAGYRPSALGRTCEGESPLPPDGVPETTPPPVEKGVTRHRRGCFRARGPSVHLEWASWGHPSSPLPPQRLERPLQIWV